MLLHRSGATGLLIVCFTTTQALAVVINSSWLTATSGDWDDAGNWSSAGYPNNNINTYNATIDATGSAYTVTLDVNITIDSLTLNSADANVNHTANTLTVLGNADLLAGSYTLSGGTIDGGTWNQSGGLLLFAVNNGNTISNGATVTGNLELNNNSGRVIFQNGATFTDDVNFNGNNAYLVINDTTTLDNKTINMSGSGSQFGIGGSNTLTLGADMLVHGRGTVGESALVGGTAQLNNQGTIRADLSGQTLSITPNVLVNEAAGLVEADNNSFLNFGSSSSSDTSTNLGNINAINGSTVRLRGNWNNTAGTVTIDATSNLEVEGDFATSDIGTIDNSAGGDVLLKSNWDNAGDSFTFDAVSGPWTMSGATITGGTINQAGSGEGLRFAINNSNTLAGGLIYNGDLNFDSGSGRLVIESGATFTGDVNMTANSTILIYNDTQAIDNTTFNLDGSGGSVSVSGNNTLTLGSGVLVRGRGSVTSGSIVPGAGQLNNNGAIRADLAGQTLTVDPDTLVNGATGVIEATNGASLNVGSTGAGDTTTNLGNLNALNGSTLRLRGDWTNTAGDITVDATSTLEIEGDFATADIGTIDNSAGGTVQLESIWDNSGESFTFDADSGSWFMLGGTVSGGTLNQGTLGEGLRFGVNNSNILTGGLIYDGDLDFGIASGRVRIEGGATFTGDVNMTANNAILIFNDTQTIDNKTVNMDGSGVTFSVSGTNTLTLGPGGLVRGRGNVTSGSIVAGTGQLNNNGAIRADLAGQTLTVDPDILANGATGVIEATNGASLNVGSTGAGDTTTNSGNINALGGSTVRMRGDWSNASGTITVDATSTLEIEGDFATSDIGTIDNSAGGTVQLESIWDNSGDSFTFDADSGSWFMLGGTVSGGTLNQGTLGEGLVFGVSNSNILTGGLVYDGDLDFGIASGRVRIEGGATFTGDVNMTANSTFLIFNDTQTLDNKTVNMDGSGVTFSVSGTNTLTLGPGGLVRGRGSLTSGAIVSGIGQLDNSGTIRADLAGQTLTVDPDTLVNGATGVIEAVNGANLNVTGSVSQNDGSFSINGGGTLTIGNGSDAVTNTGTFTATDSTMTIGGNWTNAAGAITASNSTVNLAGDFATADIGVFSRTGGTVNVTGNWDNAADSFTFDTDTGDWIMLGAIITGGTLNQGTLGEGLDFGVNNSNILTGGLVYDGDLDFNTASGRVRIEGGATFTGDVNMTANSTFLIFNDTQTLDNKTVNLNGASSQFGVGGDNTLTLGPNLLVRGRGAVDSDTIVAGNSEIINQGTLRADINGQTLSIRPDQMNNQATIEAVNGGDIRLTTTLTNLVGTTLTGGTWRVADGGNFDFEAGAITANAAQIVLQGIGSGFTVEPSNTPIEDSLTTNTAAGTLRILNNRNYAGTLAFTNAGDLELGGGTFNALSFDNQAGGELFGFGTVSPQVQSAGTVRAAGGRLVLANGLNGTGSTVEIDAGATLAFAGSDFIDTGATFSLTDGRLEGAGTIDIGTDLNQSGGTLAPGAIVGTTQLTGDYNLTGGTLETQFGGAGNPIDLLEATGNISLAIVGTSLDLRPVQGMAAGAYTLLRTTGGTIAGTFANVTDLGIYDNLVGVQYTATTVTLTLDRDLIYGDLNWDGFVGIADLDIVLGHWNQNVAAGAWSLGDPTNDGFVGIGDLDVVLGHWNQGTPPTLAEALSQVPEPGTLGVLGVLGGLALRRRRPAC